jgi:hypothetical protein
VGLLAALGLLELGHNMMGVLGYIFLAIFLTFSVCKCSLFHQLIIYASVCCDFACANK